MRVAFASSDGINVDEHFGQASTFHVWEIDPNQAAPTEVITGLERGLENEDHILTKAQALQGCVIVCSLRIGGPAAAKLVARRIHPLKTDDVVAIQAMVGKLQNALRDSAPPWLAKAMGRSNPRRMRADAEV
jgi:nitrogen fixation protein NifX